MSHPETVFTVAHPIDFMPWNRADLLFPFTFMIILSEHMFVNPYFSFSQKYLQKDSQSYSPVHYESYRPIQINHA